MDPEEEILPEDDSVFDEILGEEDVTLNASDAILEDSFSSLPDVTNAMDQVTPPVTSTPHCKARRVTRSQRAASPQPTSTNTATACDSPSSRTRSRTRMGGSPAPAVASSPTSRRRPRAREESPLPQAASTSTGRISRRDSMPTSSSQRAQSTRIKCPLCPSSLANQRTFEVHKRMHTLKRAFSRAANREKFLEDLPSLITKTLDVIHEEEFVGEFKEPVKLLCQQMKDTFNNFEEEHQDLCSLQCEHFHKILSDHCSVFSSSLVHSFYVGVNRLLNNSDFVQTLKTHILGLGDSLTLEPSSLPVLNVFVGHFMHVLSSETVVYFIRTIHGATVNDEIRKKRSNDIITSKEFLELSYYIGGCVVHTFIRKSEKYESKENWKRFSCVLKDKFLRSAGVGSVVTSEVSHFTDKVDRGKLTHISQAALDFFLVLFDLLMSLEGSDGLPANVINSHVLEDSTILCLWDVLVGSELDDDTSLDFLMQMSETCKKNCYKRNNAEALK